MERYVDFDEQDMGATIDLRCIVDALFPTGYDLTPDLEGRGKFAFSTNPGPCGTRLSVPSWPRGFGFLGPDPEAMYAAAAYRWWLLAGPGMYKSPRDTIIAHVKAKFGPYRSIYRAAKLHAATIGWFNTAMSMYNDAPKIVQKPLTRLNRRAVFNQMYLVGSDGQMDYNWKGEQSVWSIIMKAAFNPGLAKYLNDGGIL